VGRQQPHRLIWTYEEDPDGGAIAYCNRGGYRFTVRQDPVDGSLWRPDVDPRLVRAFVSFKPFSDIEEAMDFCERWALPATA
jgi:hypothetical protein